MEHILLATTVAVAGGATALAVVCARLRSDNQRLFLQNLALQEELSANNRRWNAAMAQVRRAATAAQHDAVDSVQAELDVERMLHKRTSADADRERQRHSLEVDDLRKQIAETRDWAKAQVDAERKASAEVRDDAWGLAEGLSSLYAAVVLYAQRMDNEAVVRGKRGQWRRLRTTVERSADGKEYRIRPVLLKPKPKG